jgi:predicted nucleic acid-binding protein
MQPLCDPNVLTELARPQPDRGVLDWAGSVSVVGVSAVTVEEVLYGLTWKPRPKTLGWFEAFLDDFCVVLPVTEEVARVGGSLRGRLQSDGRTRTQADMLIAATAIVHGVALVTRNVRDFEDCGVTLLNPFSSPSRSAARIDSGSDGGG